MKLRIDEKQRMKTRIMNPKMMKLQRASLERENEDEIPRTKFKTKPPSRLVLRHLSPSRRTTRPPPRVFDRNPS